MLKDYFQIVHFVNQFPMGPGHGFQVESWEKVESRLKVERSPTRPAVLLCQGMTLIFILMRAGLSFFLKNTTVFLNGGPSKSATSVAILA